MNTLVLDAASVLRRLSKRPGFALAVMLILALGIGANTATLNLLYGYLLAPLPYPRASELVNVHFSSTKMPSNLSMSWRTYFDLHAQMQGISDSGMFELESVNLVSGSQAVHVRGAAASASLFSTLEVYPVLGRVFGPSANQPGAPGQVVLSYRLWARLFGRSPAILGQTIRLNDEAYTVIGVMPETFLFPDSDTDLWLPYIFSPFEFAPSNLMAWHGTMVARLRRGVAPMQLATEAQAMLERKITSFPRPTAIPLLRSLDLHLDVTPLRSVLVGALKGRIVLTQAATGLLLLSVWFNLANLFIARALAQRAELIVRRVLGAGTRILIRQLFFESLTLCLLGSLAGLMLGEVLLRILLQSGFGSEALSFPLGDWGVAAAIAVLLAVLSALVFSIACLYFIRRQELAQALRNADARSAGRRGDFQVRAALVVSQLGLTFALIGIGSMLAHSVMKLDKVALGFQPEHIVSFQILLPSDADSTGQRNFPTQLERLRNTLSSLPGVVALTIASEVPFDGNGTGYSAFSYPYDGKHTPELFPVVADAGYIATFGIPLVAGRQFTSRDSVSDEGHAVIDVSAAQELFGTTDVVGRKFNFNEPNDSMPNQLFTIVGLVGITRHGDVGGEGGGMVYLNREQVLRVNTSSWSWSSPTWYVAVRTSFSVGAILPELSRAVAQTLSGVPVYDVRTMNERLSKELTPRRGLAALVLLFGIGALSVSAVGLYAVQSYSIGLRRSEFGIRAALGADHMRLRNMVLGDVFRLLVIGSLVGFCGVIVLARVFSGVLYGVKAVDPASLAIVLTVLSVTAVVAGWVPAWRASRVPPMEALRNG
jgi:putative ABC transport system permease protein